MSKEIRAAFLQKKQQWFATKNNKLQPLYINEKILEENAPPNVVLISMKKTPVCVNVNANLLRRFTTVRQEKLEKLEKTNKQTRIILQVLRKRIATGAGVVYRAV